MEELLSLKWNNHKSTFLHILTILRDKQMFTDATLACEGKFYSVHRLVLSTCSDYFSAMFDRTECKNPIIVLKDINCEDLEALLDYMYLGEVNVKQSELSSLIKAAECLRVKGLAVPDDEIPKKGSSSKKSDSIHSPTAKRKRSDDEPSKSSRRRSVLNSESNNSGTESKPSTSVISEVVDKIPFVKVEREDIEDSFDVNHTDFKIENNDINNSGEDGSNQVPSFLPNEEAFADQAYSESYQPGDDGWPGEGSNFSDQLNFTSTDQSTNASGSDVNPSAVVCCSICRREFRGRNMRQNLRHHSMIHSGEKPYTCLFCGYTCNRNGNLQMHIKKHHIPVKDSTVYKGFSF